MGDFTFELKDRDLCAKIGVLELGGKRIETPLFFPVVDLKHPIFRGDELRRGFKVDALFTNAYLIYKNERLKEEALNRGIHELLGFDGVVATDSGAYQSYVYGEVELEPSEIERFQENIGSDIAVILDLPVNLRASYEEAERNVMETVRRAKENVKRRKRRDTLWYGPVHGARHISLVERSAEMMSKLDFGFYALGSVVEALANYQFDMHVDMIMAARRNLPLSRPMHIFGVGHPLFFSLPVAMGCDSFDSAAYALFAYDDRYMTEYGTTRISDMDYFPCACAICNSHTPREVRDLPREERVKVLASHNLYACTAEVRRIKEAIKEGRLWELIEVRARSHPKLLRALLRLGNYADYVERLSPAFKGKGLFFFGSSSLARPEITRHILKMEGNYAKPAEARFLLLLPQTEKKPFHEAHPIKEILGVLGESGHPQAFQAAVYAVPFGIIPLEIDEVFPLSQFEIGQIDEESMDFVGKQVKDFALRQGFEKVILVTNGSETGSRALRFCEEARSAAGFELLKFGYEGSWSEETKNRFINMIRQVTFAHSIHSSHRGGMAHPQP